MNTNRLVIIIIALILQLKSSGQENPYRIGIKLGKPYITCLNLEYLLESSQNRFAISTDIMILPYKSANFDFNFKYLGIGGKYYLLKEQCGLYSGLNIDYFTMKRLQKNTIIENEETDDLYYDGTINENAKGISFKPNIGYRFIYKWFTIAPEIGYSFNTATKYTKTSESIENNYRIEKDLNKDKVFGKLYFTLSTGVVF